MLDDSRVEHVLKLLKPTIKANKCYFCHIELNEKEQKAKHGLCGDCWWFRRWAKKLRLGTNRK